ncbi:Uncharacterized protein dnm_034610 [Desulfonema magnum]|uniref:Uncharacterized protein n=1 Tax=Desulfonema magnum TaxID=45655 RepID=A0A975BKV5_9BACT|nr:Uncharacterized protein dnm_034610 [Desulfonema magnum]
MSHKHSDGFPLTRFVTSAYLPCFFPSDRHARHHLPFGGSSGQDFPAFPTGAFRSGHRYYYVPLRPPTAHLRFVRFSLSLPDDTLSASSLSLIGRVRAAPSDARTPRHWLTGTPDRIYFTRKRPALPSSRGSPVNTCPGLRPRRYPTYSPRPGIFASLSHTGLPPSVR